MPAMLRARCCPQFFTAYAPVPAASTIGPQLPIALRQYYDANRGNFFLHHPFDADVISNVGVADSFAEIYREDKLMPFIGGTQEANDQLVKAGSVGGRRGNLSLRRPPLITDLWLVTNR